MEYSNWLVTLLVLLSAGIFGYISVKIESRDFLALAIFSASLSWVPFLQILVFVAYVCTGLVYGSYYGAKLIMVKLNKKKTPVINGGEYF